MFVTTWILVWLAVERPDAGAVRPLAVPRRKVDLVPRRAKPAFDGRRAARAGRATGSWPGSPACWRSPTRRRSGRRAGAAGVPAGGRASSRAGRSPAGWPAGSAGRTRRPSSLRFGTVARPSDRAGGVPVRCGRGCTVAGTATRLSGTDAAAWVDRLVDAGGPRRLVLERWTPRSAGRPGLRRRAARPAVRCGARVGGGAGGRGERGRALGHPAPAAAGERVLRRRAASAEAAPEPPRCRSPAPTPAELTGPRRPGAAALTCTPRRRAGGRTPAPGAARPTRSSGVARAAPAGPLRTRGGAPRRPGGRPATARSSRRAAHARLPVRPRAPQRPALALLRAVRHPDERADPDLVRGPRPPLGLLVFDDGATYTVDADYLVGRMPDGDERVRSGELRAIARRGPHRLGLPGARRGPAARLGRGAGRQRLAQRHLRRRARAPAGPLPPHRSRRLGRAPGPARRPRVHLRVAVGSRTCPGRVTLRRASARRGGSAPTPARGSWSGRRRTSAAAGTRSTVVASPTTGSAAPPAAPADSTGSAARPCGVDPVPAQRLAPRASARRAGRAASVPPPVHRDRHRGAGPHRPCAASRAADRPPAPTRRSARPRPRRPPAGRAAGQPGRRPGAASPTSAGTAAAVGPPAPSSAGSGTSTTSASAVAASSARSAAGSAENRATTELRTPSLGRARRPAGAARPRRWRSRPGPAPSPLASSSGTARPGSSRASTTRAGSLRGRPGRGPARPAAPAVVARGLSGTATTTVNASASPSSARSASAMSRCHDRGPGRRGAAAARS